MTSTRSRSGVLCAVLAALVCGCAPLASKDERAAEAKQVDEQPASSALQLPAQELSQGLLYEYLIAEMAIHRGQFGIAAQAYVDLARKTRDPRIARRATDIAV